MPAFYPIHDVQRRRERRSKTGATSTSTTTSLFYSSSNSLRSESLLKNVAVESVSLRSKNAVAAAAAVQIMNKKKSLITRTGGCSGDNKINDWLKDLGLPRGLRDTLIRNIQEDGGSSKRIWIIDNSGSMKMEDGQCNLSSIDDGSGDKKKKKKKIINGNDAATAASAISINFSSNSNECTRWAEAKETVNCHAQLNSVLSAPTDFRLLNPPDGGPQKFRVGYNNKSSSSSNNRSIFRRRYSDSQRAEKIMIRNKPKGKTPLHEAVQDVRKEVIRMLPRLRADGTTVTIVICTDGTTNTNTDDTTSSSSTYVDDRQELEDALKSLSGLPVCVVIRLCTDYGDVVEFYNGLDARMSIVNNETPRLLLDVLNDYEAEAKQVYRHNPWLNYALILHRMREWGLQGSSELLDLLNQRSFSHDEIRSFCALLFGTTFDLLPDPSYDEDNFVAQIEYLQQKEHQFHWNPNTNCRSSWIDIDALVLALK